VKGARVGLPCGQGNLEVQVTAHGSHMPRTAQGDVPGRFGLRGPQGNQNVRGALLGYPVGRVTRM
jgi:hypothetical protein